MTNTIPNVPRELLERVLNAGWGSETVNALDDLRDFLESASSSANHVEDVRAMVAAPSPAGGGGLEVVAWRIGFPNNAGYKVYEQRQPWAYEQYGVPSVIVYEVQELCRLSDAQAIIDGLRGEVAELKQSAQGKLILRLYQHAKRIGELEGLLRSCLPALSDGGCAALANRIDAALSAGKDGGGDGQDSKRRHHWSR